MKRTQSRRIRVILGLCILAFLTLSTLSPALEPISANGGNVIHTCTEMGTPSLEATSLSDTVWKGKKVLTVSFQGGPDLFKSKVRHFAQIWSNYANIRFEFIENGPADIRISFTHDGRSSSSIGNGARTVSAQKATMNFGWFDKDTSDMEFQAVILHEFGHALGLIHEHQSPNANIPFNKPAVYKYYSQPPYEWNENMVNENIFNKYAGYRKRSTAYDPLSIMIYPIPAELTRDGSSVNFNTNLSEMDKALIKKLYP